MKKFLAATILLTSFSSFADSMVYCKSGNSSAEAIAKLNTSILESSEVTWSKSLGGGKIKILASIDPKDANTTVSAATFFPHKFEETACVTISGKNLAK